MPQDVYSTDEVDDKLAAIDVRLAALENGEPVPPDPPQPLPEGVDLVVDAFTPPALTQGVPAHLAVTITNDGDADVPPGVIIGVGFFADDVQATWASTQDGLAAGAEVELSTATAPMSGGAWRPANAGPAVLMAYVDDLNRIPEWSDDNNMALAEVEVAEGTAPAPGASTLFAASSTWNTPKSPTQYNGASDGLLRGKNYGLNNGPYSHPMTWSTAADPIHTIQCPDTWGWPATTLHVNMRDDATPAGGSDGHLCLLNSDGRLIDMWILRPTGTRAWRCEAWAQHNWQSGSGWGQPPYGPSAGVTVSGAPTAAGTITADEVEAGVIPHALCMAFAYGDMHAPHVPPAIANDVGGGGGPLQEGALLFATGGEPAGLNAAEHALYVAASTFGCYIVDKLDGDPMFYGDRSDVVGQAFRGDKLTAIGRTLRQVAP